MRFDDDRAAHYPERGWWSPADTLSQWLVRAASDMPDAPAIVGDGQSLSYDALAKRVAALAGGLEALGLGSGDVVAVQLPNRAEYLVSYLAICAIGGVMTTLYVPYRTAEMEPLLAHFGARAFIGLDEMGDFRPARTVLDLRRRRTSPPAWAPGGRAPRRRRRSDSRSSAPAETSPSRVAARTSSTAAASSTTPGTSKTCSPLTRRST